MAGVVMAGTTVLPLTMLAASTCAAIVIGGRVVPGRVVLYVDHSPKALTGIALPTPEAVYWVGNVSVAVLGFDPVERYMLPELPSLIVKLPDKRLASPPE